MKMTATIAFFFVSLCTFAAQSEAVNQLGSLIKPGTYFGSYKNNDCAFHFTVKNNIAYLELNTDRQTITHEFTDHEGIVFKGWKGEFMSNYINRTNDATVYSMDTFRILKNEEYTYVVIEKLFVNNRDLKRQKIECLL